MPYLLKVSGDYADEFDVSGICSVNEQVISIEALRKAITPQQLRLTDFEWCFGTNEFVMSSKVSYEIVEASQPEIDILSRILSPETPGVVNYGVLNVEYFLDHIQSHSSYKEYRLLKDIPHDYYIIKKGIYVYSASEEGEEIFQVAREANKRSPHIPVSRSDLELVVPEE